MGKNPGYLPASAWTVGAMIDDQLLVTWGCGICKAGGRVDLLDVQRKLGPSYCLVDREPRCKTPDCAGRVLFHYSPGRGTPTRPLRAARERLDALRAQDAQRQMEAARQVFNAVAAKNGGQQLPPLDRLFRLLIRSNGQT